MTFIIWDKKNKVMTSKGLIDSNGDIYSMLNPQQDLNQDDFEILYGFQYKNTYIYQGHIVAGALHYEIEGEGKTIIEETHTMIGKVCFEEGSFILKSFVTVDIGEGQEPEEEVHIADFDEVDILGHVYTTPELIEKYTFEQGVYKVEGLEGTYRFDGFTIDGEGHFFNTNDYEDHFTLEGDWRKEVEKA